MGNIVARHKSANYDFKQELLNCRAYTGRANYAQNVNHINHIALATHRHRTMLTSYHSAVVRGVTAVTLLRHGACECGGDSEC